MRCRIGCLIESPLELGLGFEIDSIELINLGVGFGFEDNTRGLQGPGVRLFRQEKLARDIRVRIRIVLK